MMKGASHLARPLLVSVAWHLAFVATPSYLAFEKDPWLRKTSTTWSLWEEARRAVFWLPASLSTVFTLKPKKGYALL